MPLHASSRRSNWDRTAAGDGSELPGSWRIVPERGGWAVVDTDESRAASMMTIAGSYRGKPNAVLREPLARTMLTRQNGGPHAGWAAR